MRSFDLVVIGTGPAGRRAAIQAAKLGAHVAAVEQRATIGGAAIHAGTIPSKTLREAILYLTGLRQRGIYGGDYRLKEHITIGDLTLRLNLVLDHELAVMQDQLQRNGIALLHGRARFTGHHTLQVSGACAAEELHAEIVILAPGSSPSHSPTVPVDGTWVVDADLLYENLEIPKRAIIIGAGAIGIEYASMFGALGVAVTVCDQRQQILEFLDREILDALMAQMRQTGVTFQLGEEVAAVTVQDGTVTARGVSGKRFEAEALLYAVGRNGNTEELGLERVGLTTDPRGRITVDTHYRTAVPYIYAAGDVIGFPALAATSMEQGRLAARYALGAPNERIQGLLPIGIYAIPEISMVGRTEEQLVADGLPYVVGSALYAETARGQILGDTSGRLKLLVDTQTHQLLGVHIIGENATELIHIGQSVMALGGRVEYLVANVFNYPTLAECYKIAALDAFNKISGAEPSTRAATAGASDTGPADGSSAAD